MPQPKSPRSRRLISALVALAAGAAVGLAFPPVGAWPLLPVGLALLGWLTAVRRPRLRAGFGLGYLFGVGFFGVLIRWMLVVEVWLAMPALVAVMAFWCGLAAWALTWLGRFPGWPVFAASAWIVVEFLASRWPLGGFPWGRLAYAAAGTPIDGWFPLVSVTGVSWLIAVTSFLVPWAAKSILDARRGGQLNLNELFADTPAVTPTTPTPGVAGGASVTPVPLPQVLEDALKPLALLSVVRRAVLAWVVFGLVGLGGWAGGQFQPAPTDQTVTIGLIQGNVPGVGLDALGAFRTTTHNSLAQTIALMARVGTGELPAPDFVVWPESSLDTDPNLDAETARLIDTAADIAKAPILVGGLTEFPQTEERYTTSAWWPGGQGATSVYHKKNIVPFGEWIPLRSLLEPIFPVLHLVGYQTIPGDAPGVVLGQLRDGRTVPVGVLLCFEVGYDDTADAMLRGDANLPGAQVVAVQTNNSALTGTGQMAQQDAITAIRAMEARRDVVVATTNSLAGWIAPDGRHRWQATPRQSAATSVTVPLRTALTPAIAHRRTIEGVLVIGPALLLGLVAWRGHVTTRKKAAR